MRVLAIDTSGDAGVVAVTANGEVRAELHSRARARQGEALLPAIERALAMGELTIADIELIAIGLGPGSFTGVRIGVATAKGLALARRTPIVGVRTTRVIARGLFGALRVPVIDAHKGEVFVAAYEARDDGTLVSRDDERHGPPAAMAEHLRAVLGEAARPVLAGSGLALHRDAFTLALGAPAIVAPRAFDVPRGALLALEAEEAFVSRGADELGALEPLYVRASDALLPASSRTTGPAAER